MVDLVREMLRAYQGTTISIKDGKKTRPVLVHDIKGSKSIKKVSSLSIIFSYTGVASTNEVKIEDRFDFTFPELGVFNIDNYVIHLTRIPNRQWRKGYTERVVHLSCLIRDEINMIETIFRSRGDSQVIHEVFNPIYYELEEALQSVSSLNRLAAAFSNKFFFYLKDSSKNILVGYKGFCIGWVKDDEVMLPRQSYHLYEELSQHITCRRV